MVPQWQWKAVMMSSVFLSCVSFAIVMPSLWPYLSSLNSTKAFLAFVVAAYSVGEAVGAVAFGCLSSSSTRRTYLAATVLGAAGSVLYIIAPLYAEDHSHTGATLVLISRLLLGAWTGGAQAVQQVHLAKVLSSPDHLSATTVQLNAYACLGFVFGPFFGLVASSIAPFSVGFGLHFNELTAPGYFVFLSSLFIAVLYTFAFGEDDEHLPPVESIDDATPLLPPSPACSHDVALLSPTLIPSLIVCNVAFFVHFFGFALQETVTTPLVQSFYSWTVFDANLLFTAGGGVSLLAFGALALLTSRVSERALASSSLAIGALGFALLMSTPDHPLHVPRFLAGFAAIYLAFPVGRATFIAIYTKLLPKQWQGPGQGIILAVGAAARIMGPFWAVHAFELWLGGMIVFGMTAFLFIAAWLLVAISYSSLEADGDKLVTARAPSAV